MSFNSAYESMFWANKQLEALGFTPDEERKFRDIWDDALREQTRAERAARPHGVWEYGWEQRRCAAAVTAVLKAGGTDRHLMMIQVYESLL